MKALSSTVAGNIVPTVNYSVTTYTLTGLVIGTNYSYSMGTNDTSIAFSGGATFAKSVRSSGVFTATATSATLTGTGYSAVQAVISPIFGVSLYPATVTPTAPARQITIGQFPSNNPNFSRQIQISDQFVFVKRGTYSVAINLADVVNIALTEEVNLTWTPPVSLVQPVSTTAAGLAAATGTLTIYMINVANGNTVTIGTKVYTFQTTLTNVDGNVKIGASNYASMTNLFNAINASGGTAGTDYALATTAHPQVTATNPTNITVVLTAKNAGFAGNSIATTAVSVSSTLTFGGATLSGGTVSPVTFTFSAGSEYTITYQWQYLNGSTWTDITSGSAINGTVYSGYTSATLTATSSTNGQSGVSHRCIVTDNAGSFGLTNGSLTGNSVTLTFS
tara:strand:+ start:18280 stop:19455 length:1176 start_codon:yes stop_codon:yes gene_type:complete